MELLQKYNSLVENPRNVFVQTVEGDLISLSQELSMYKLSFFGNSEIQVYPGSFNPLHDGHRSIYNGINSTSKYFETSITRWQKAPLSLEDLETRLKQFVGYAPVIVTNSARFIEKAGVLCVFPNIRFHVGIDTLTRMRDDYGDIGIEGLRANFIVYDRIVNGNLLSLKSEFSSPPRNCKIGFERPKELLSVSSTEIRNKQKNEK